VRGPGYFVKEAVYPQPFARNLIKMELYPSQIAKLQNMQYCMQQQNAS